MTLERVDLEEVAFSLADEKSSVYMATAPKAEDYARLINTDCLLYIGGKLAGIQLQLPEQQVSRMRAAVQAIEYQTTARSAGLKTTSRVIGYQPRMTTRRDFCTAAALAKEAPRAHSDICQGAVLASDILAEHLPEQHAQQRDLLGAKIRAGWQLNGGCFTSGICNWNNQLRYHYDGGNLPSTWNAMFTFKRDLAGGYLSVPQLGIALGVPDASLTIFNAQGFMHGVTPFRKLTGRAYRYTVVFYAMAGMCHCGTPAEELGRIRKLKTDRENKRRSTT